MTKCPGYAWHESDPQTDCICDTGECPCDSPLYATGDCPIHDTRQPNPEETP